jgi:hypothetical protein
MVDDKSTIAANKPMDKTISRADIETLISRDPGSYAIYKVWAVDKIETLFYSPDRPAACGYSPEEYAALAKEASGLVLKDDRPLLAPVLQRALATGEDVELNYRVVHKTMGFIWLHAIYRSDWLRRRDSGFLRLFDEQHGRNQGLCSDSQ